MVGITSKLEINPERRVVVDVNKPSDCSGSYIITGVSPKFFH